MPGVPTEKINLLFARNPGLQASWATAAVLLASLCLVVDCRGFAKTLLQVLRFLSSFCTAPTRASSRGSVCLTALEGKGEMGGRNQPEFFQLCLECAAALPPLLVRSRGLHSRPAPVRGALCAFASGQGGCSPLLRAGRTEPSSPRSRGEKSRMELLAPASPSPQLSK